MNAVEVHDLDNVQTGENASAQMSYPNITVGIPTHDSEKTVANCLRSVLDSDYEKAKMEIIVADGKSHDHTLKIVKKFQQIAKRNGIRFRIVDDGGKGLGYARQLIVENAHGEYVFWVDSDSIVPRNLIRAQVDFMNNRPLVGMAIPLVLPTGKSLIERLQGYRCFTPTLYSLKTKRAPYTTMQGSINPLKVLRDVEGFNINLRGSGEDNDLIHRIKIKGFDVIANPKAIVYHHMKMSYKEIFRQAAWYGRTGPKKPIRTLIKKCLVNPLMFIKLFPLSFETFRDPACILLPFHDLLWNLFLLVSHFSERN